MVTAETNDADGWNISIINDGKYFLKLHPFHKRGNGIVNISLTAPGLCKLMFGGSLEPEGERDILEISIFSFKPKIEMTLAVCQIC